MADWKKIWNDTPANISGMIVIGLLILFIGFVCWTWFSGNYNKSINYIATAAIGGTLAYKIIRNKKLVLDPERVVEGKLALVLGIVSSLLFIISAVFAILLFVRLAA